MECIGQVFASNGIGVSLRIGASLRVAAAGLALTFASGCASDDSGGPTPIDSGASIPPISMDSGTDDPGSAQNDSGVQADVGTIPDGAGAGPDGSMDASVPNDGGMTPDGGNSTSSDCRNSSALFCEDFESLPLGPASSNQWSTEGNGSLTIDDARTFGDRSLRIETQFNGFAFLDIPFSPPNNSFHARMMVYVEAFPSAPDWAHYTLVEITGSGSSERIRPVGGQFVPPSAGGPGDFWGIGADGGATGDWRDWRLSAPSVPGRWLCIQWNMQASNNFIRLTIDDVQNDELTADTTRHGGNEVDFVFPDIDRVKVGWQLYQGGSTPSEFRLWIDNIVFDDQPVACPPR